MILSSSSRVRRFGFAAAVGALSTLLVAGAAVPAFAASPAVLSVAVTADTASATTGTAADFTIGYSCTGAVACEGTLITVPLPDFVDAARPGWGWSWWNAPVLTNSADVASSTTATDGTVTFMMKDTLAPGTTGTVGIRYTPTTLTTPDGSTLSATATIAGSNADPAAASDSMVLNAPTKAAAMRTDQGQSFNYLDQDLVLRNYIWLNDTAAIGIEGIDTVTTFTQTLPAGAQFVSSNPMPDSISGNVLTWNNLPDSGDSYEPGRRVLDVVVKFPSSSFSNNQNVQVTGTAEGTYVGGSSFAVSSNVTLQLQTYVEKLEPYVQVTGSHWSYTGVVAARGASYSWSYYLNNYNSTTPATSAVISTDMADGFILSTIGTPAGLTIDWTSDSGATGSYTTTENAAVSLADLGVPEGDRVVHLDVDFGAVEAPGSRSFALNGTTTDESVSTVNQCASLLMTAASGTTATANGCGSYGIVDPYIIPSVGLQAPTDGQTYRPGSTIAWDVNVFNQTQGNHDWQPVLYFVVPKGTKVAADPISWNKQWCAPSDDYATPIVEVKTGAVEGQDLLVISWPGAPAIAPGGGYPDICGLQINTTVTTAPAGTIDAALYGGDARGPITGPFTGYNPDSTDTNYWTSLVGDDRGIVDGGTGSTVLARSIASAATGTGASLQSNLTAKGSLDSDFVTVPQRAATESGKPVAYKLPIQNTGNVPLKDIVIYDILPHVGDTGVSAGAAGQPRGSQFAPTLQGPVTAPAGFSVQYSTSINPCRPEVNPDATDCVDDWTSTPSDFGAVRSLKFIQDVGTELAPGDGADISWSMQISQDVPAAQVAFNSAAFSATRADNGQALAAEPAPIGVEVAVADLAITITDGDLLQNATSLLPVTVTNNGPSAEIATVTITAPEGFTLGLLDDATGWVCTIADNTATCVSTVPLVSGSTDTLPLTLTVADAGITGTIEASVSGPFPDPNPANNTATATFKVVDELPTLPVVTPTDGALAYTGTTIGLAVTFGLLALLAGGLLIAARRRKPTDRQAELNG